MTTLMAVPSILSSQARDSTCTPAPGADSLTATFTVQVSSANPNRPVPESFVRTFLNEFRARLRVPEPLVLGTYVAPLAVESGKDWNRGFAGLFAMLAITVEERRATPVLLVSTAVPAFDQALLETVRAMEADSAVPALPQILRGKPHELRLRVTTVQEPEGGLILFRLRVPVVVFASPARPQLQMAGRLRYPPEMRRARREGSVLTQFVIDERGEPLRQSLGVLKATHPLFGESVVEFVSNSRFEPARIGSCPVALIVTQDFNFTLR
jgi:TonB family protein